MSKTINFTLTPSVGPPTKVYTVHVPWDATCKLVEQAMITEVAKSEWGKFFDPSRREFCVSRIDAANPWYVRVAPGSKDFRNGETVLLDTLT